MHLPSLKRIYLHWYALIFTHTPLPPLLRTQVRNEMIDQIVISVSVSIGMVLYLLHLGFCENIVFPPLEAPFVVVTSSGNALE